MTKSKLTVLGCGDAFASGGRFCSSFFIESLSTGLILDCGVSTLIRLKQLAIDLDKVEAVVVSHFHGDHYGGLPFLFLAMRFESRRSKPITIVGPKGIREKTYELQEALYPDTSFVIDELDVRFVEFGKEWLALDPFSIQAYPVTHAPSSMPHGVRLRWSGKVLGFSGDTEWDDNLIKIAQDTEIMICECNMCKYPVPGHLDYETLRKKAPLMKTKQLVLTHLGPEMLDEAITFEKLEDGQELELW